jgi:hypothetical protein
MASIKYDQQIIQILKMSVYNSILIYLRANLTAQKPITKLARVRRTKQQQNTNKIRTKQGSLYSSNNIIQSIYLFIYMLTQQPKGQLIIIITNSEQWGV